MHRDTFYRMMLAPDAFDDLASDMRYRLDAVKQQNPYSQEIEQNADDSDEEDMAKAYSILKDAADAGISPEEIMEAILEEQKRELKQISAFSEKRKILEEAVPISTEKPKPKLKPRTTCKIKVFSNDKDTHRADSNTTPVAVHSIASRCRLLFARLFGRSETKDMVEGPDRKAYRSVD